MAELKAGLQDIVIATSEICSIDGAKGVLTYRGYDIHDLAAHSSFEEVVYLLWNGRLPKRAELSELEKQIPRRRRNFLTQPRQGVRIVSPTRLTITGLG